MFVCAYVDLQCFSGTFLVFNLFLRLFFMEIRVEIRGGALRQVGNGHIRLIISGRIPKRRKNAEDEKFCLGCLFVFNR